MRILLVEDHLPLAENIGEYLAARGYIIDFAYDGSMGFKLATTTPYDLLILDLSLPRLDGLALIRKLHSEGGVQVPSLMLTARDTLEDKLAGFAAGADDYLTKPFELAELEVRIQALLRRDQRRVLTLQCGDLVLDLATREVVRAGRQLKLAPTGVKILELLLRRAPAFVSREELCYHIWGDEPPDGEASLRVHIHGLRASLDKPFEHKLLLTLPGVGYRLTDRHGS